jgi:hypothetical protein
VRCFHTLLKAAETAKLSLWSSPIWARYTPEEIEKEIKEGQSVDITVKKTRKDGFDHRRKIR